MTSDTTRLRRRSLGALGVAAALAFAASSTASATTAPPDDTTATSEGGAATTAPPDDTTATSEGGAASLDDLIAAANEEGRVNLIALPADVGELRGRDRHVR